MTTTVTDAPSIALNIEFLCFHGCPYRQPFLFQVATINSIDQTPCASCEIRGYARTKGLAEAVLQLNVRATLKQIVLLASL